MADEPFAWESVAVWDAAVVPFVVKDPLSHPVCAPFSISTQLNAKISLWHGPIHRLRVDAVVNSTCESMREGDGDFGELLRAAGPEIAVECKAVGRCRTGDAVLTRGCQLPAKFILHTVGPRYLPKYHNAAEHALHSCYRSVLTIAKENGLRVVAIGCIYTQRKGYPREEAAHIAGRTVRRYLEHYADDFDRIILCLRSTQDMLVYEKILPLYFPRTTIEEQKSHEKLATRKLDVDNQETESNILTFRSMLADPDTERIGRLQQLQEDRQRRAAEAAVEEQKRLEKDTASTTDWDYVAALQRAKKEDLSDLKALNMCYCGGVDLAGLPVIVYLAGKLPVEDVKLERVLLFVLLTLEAQYTALTVTSAQFSLLYVHSSDNQPPTSWLKRLFRVFTAVAAQRAPSEHSKGEESALRFFYVLKPTFGFKLQLLLSKGYCDGGGFYNHVVYLQLPEMLSNIAPTLQLPTHIYSNVD
ncbi:GDAP2 protein isoform X1 [Phytophthora megakarya]|uniref:GDAP2 protein isoform X1 n=1 Tax=Phytophthora megakarya TaxID=4795 RepID=A0A225VH95_9STRA|nr:GDAP2 protein isoform X1 [Phytophthora megakarya]